MTARSARSGLRSVLSALTLAGLVVAGGCSGDEYVAPPPVVRTDAADAAVAAETLADLQTAITERDSAGAARLGGSGPAETLLSAVVDNATALGLGDVTFRYLTETGRTSGTDAWDGQVAVTWRIEGFDEASARIELPVSFTDGGRSIAAIGGVQGRLPLWLAGPVDVARTKAVVVAAAGAPGTASTYLSQGRRALDQVRTVVPGESHLVIEVPGDAEGLKRALDTQPGQYDAIAAVTAPVDGSDAPGSPIHVFLNRGVYDGLDPVAAQVVMTHEAVHAVTGAVRADHAPMWLIEGFADYVALRDVDLPLSRTAGQIAAVVRSRGTPKALPTAADFDPTAQHLGAVYESAWLACVTLADRGGEAALVALYDAVRDGKDLGAELRGRFGWSIADLTEAWQDRLKSLP